MKILRVINSLTIAGAERSVVGNVPYHIKNGFKVDILVLNGLKTFFLDEVIKEKINLIILGKNNNIYNPVLIFKICKIINKYDVIHVSLFPSLYWVAIAKFITRSKTKLVYTEHSTNNARRGKYIFKWIDSFIYKQYDKLVAITPETKKNLIEHLIYKPDIVTIYNGVDLEKIKHEMNVNSNYLYHNKLIGKKKYSSDSKF